VSRSLPADCFSSELKHTRHTTQQPNTHTLSAIDTHTHTNNTHASNSNIDHKSSDYSDDDDVNNYVIPSTAPMVCVYWCIYVCVLCVHACACMCVCVCVLFSEFVCSE